MLCPCLPNPNSRFSILLLLIFISSFIPVHTALAGTIRYVAPTAQGAANCSSWANACTLQTALDSAVSGDEIWAKMGVYYPGPSGSTSSTFTMKNGVAVYGGFNGTETSRDQRDWQTNKTILSGDIDKSQTLTATILPRPGMTSRVPMPITLSLSAGFDSVECFCET
jgi:hypothetical protein